MAILGLKSQDRTVRDARAFVRAAAEAFLNPSETTPFTRAHRSDWPDGPGVYGLYDATGLIYVGESGSLRARANDLFQTRNHQFRRSLGKQLFSDHPLFAPATSRRAFCQEIELSLTSYTEEVVRYAVFPTSVCRKEIEEAVCAEAANLLNRRRRRAYGGAPRFTEFAGG